MWKEATPAAVQERLDRGADLRARNQLFDQTPLHEATGSNANPAVVALQALMSYKRAKALEDNVETTERGQRQERLKNAIEHLGNDRDSVRLGGAYELFHLAEDAEDLGQRQTMLDILCAHIRWTTGEPEYREKYRWKPSEEIQSLLTLLFVQEHQVFTGRRISLQGSWLNGSNLRQARLGKADLNGAQLHRADLWRARLHGARLRGAQLHGVRLVEAQLHGADLSEVQLHGADLWRARLRGASRHPGESYDSFEVVINRRIGKQSYLSEDIFAGRLTSEEAASIGTGLPEQAAEKLRAELQWPREETGSQELQENNGAATGEYTKEEADQWIAEYKTAVSGGDS